MKSISPFLKKYGYLIFKYAVYLALLINVCLFLRKDLASAAHRFGADFSIYQVFEAFTNTLDTAAWVLLLLLFELVTFVLPKAKMTPFLTGLFRLISGICFIIIFNSFLGYLRSYFWLQNFAAIPIDNLCGLVGESWMAQLDAFTTIQKETCASLAESDSFFQHATKNIYTDNFFLKEANWLASIDVLNSFSWILVALLLELAVIFKYQKIAVNFSYYVKNVLYGLLLFCAIYWGIYGDFLEFWDAFLWIIAFVFIELNILGWGSREGN